MPELPEVETVVRTLKPLLKNKKIIDVKIYVNKLVKEPSLSLFKKQLKNQKINDITRIGKHILFHLDKNVLISHLRMEGKYYFFKNQKVKMNTNHVMAKIIFSDKSVLLYHDFRKFGTFNLKTYKNYLTEKPLTNVGPEPWDKKCTSNYLFSKLQKRKIAIKSVLLDQKVMAGLGNIYVNEVLHVAKINPLTPAFKITLEQSKRLINISKKILKEATKLGGSSISSYTSSLGISGKFQNKLRVHTRKDMLCLTCKKSKIEKREINGRGTYYCPICQK